MARQPMTYVDDEGVIRLNVWFGDLDGAVPARQPQQPSRIVTGAQELEAFPDLAALAQALAELLDGRRAVLFRSVATFEGYDSFPAYSIHAEGPRGESGGPPATSYLCTVAVQLTTRAELDAAIVDAQQARRAA